MEYRIFCNLENNNKKMISHCLGNSTVDCSMTVLVTSELDSLKFGEAGGGGGNPAAATCVFRLESMHAVGAALQKGNRGVLFTCLDAGCLN